MYKRQRNDVEAFMFLLFIPLALIVYAVTVGYEAYKIIQDTK